MSRNHPYLLNPDYTFWDRAVSEKAVGEINPALGEPSFQIQSTDPVMTMGSCFAQHVSNRLSKEGCNFLVTENHPNNQGLNADAGFGVFTARYGNIYTIDQAIQLAKRCLGQVAGGDIWTHKGRFIDSYRPRAIPGGFDSIEALLKDREEHLDAVLKGFQSAKILVFTLGLTEGWKNTETGQIYPIAPGVAGGEYDPSVHQPFNMSVLECISGLQEFSKLLRGINPMVKIILTVSPVPLAATHSGKHVLTATFSSKSKLRAAAELISESDKNVDYFPSFEIIQGLAQSGRYFEHNLREVRANGVDHVMRIFFDRYFLKIAKIAVGLDSNPVSEQELKNSQVLCDEDIFIGMGKKEIEGHI